MSQAWRIVTYNTWKCDGLYRDRLKWMAAGLEALAPDIVCLQEAFECPERYADTSAYLARHLNMEVQTLKSRQKRRPFEGELRQSRSNLTVLSKKPLARDSDVPLLSHDKDADRWIMQLTITQRDGSHLKLINTHLTHLHGSPGDRLRASQAKQLRRVIEAAKAPTILCGDLNATWEETSLSSISQLKWLNPVKDVGGPTMLGERSGSNAPSRQIDHIQVHAGGRADIWIQKRFSALNMPVGPRGEYPSDHAALVADLIIEGGD